MIRACRLGIDHFVTDIEIEVGFVTVKLSISTRALVFPVRVKVCDPQVTTKSSGMPSYGFSENCSVMTCRVSTPEKLIVAV